MFVFVCIQEECCNLEINRNIYICCSLKIIDNQTGWQMDIQILRGINTVCVCVIICLFSVSVCVHMCCAFQYVCVFMCLSSASVFVMQSNTEAALNIINVFISSPSVLRKHNHFVLVSNLSIHHLSISLPSSLSFLLH